MVVRQTSVERAKLTARKISFLIVVPPHPIVIGNLGKDGCLPERVFLRESVNSGMRQG